MVRGLPVCQRVTYSFDKAQFIIMIMGPNVYWNLNGTGCVLEFSEFFTLFFHVPFRLCQIPLRIILITMHFPIRCTPSGLLMFSELCEITTNYNPYDALCIFWIIDHSVRIVWIIVNFTSIRAQSGL